MPRFHRRSRRAPLGAAVVAALLALPVAPPGLGAQAPCVDGTIADYLALGATGCRLGRVTFANFTLVDEILQPAVNATILTPRLDSGVFPFRGGAIGVPGFGFQFEELFNGVEILTNAPVARGRVRTTFAFTFESAVREIRRARTIGGVFVTETQSPDDLEGRARADVTVAGGGSTCLDFRRQRTDGGRIFDVADPCLPDAITAGTVTYVLDSRLVRSGGTGTAEGLAGAGILVAAFRGPGIATTVPEPSTAALLAGGLLAVGAAARRRTR